MAAQIIQLSAYEILENLKFRYHACLRLGIRARQWGLRILLIRDDGIRRPTKKPQDICTKIRVCGKNSAFKEKIMKIDPSQHICQTCLCVSKFSH